MTEKKNKKSDEIKLRSKISTDIRLRITEMYITVSMKKQYK